MAEIPEHQVLLEMLEESGQERWRDDRVGPQHRVQCEIEVALDMRQLVLVWVRKRRTADCHCRVFFGGIDLHRLGRRGHQLLHVRYLHLLQRTLDDRSTIEKIGVLVHVGHYRLGLGHPLSLGEYVRIAHRNHVSVPIKIFAANVQLLDHVAHSHLVQIPTIDTLKYLQDPRL